MAFRTDPAVQAAGGCLAGLGFGECGLQLGEVLGRLGESNCGIKRFPTAMRPLPGQDLCLVHDG